MSEFFVSIDIGTAQTKTIIAENTSDGLILKGISIVPSEGVARGVVTNIEKAGRALRRSISEAEKIAQLKIREATVSFGGNSWKFAKSKGVVTVSKNRNIVTAEDVEALVNAAKKITLPPNTQVIDYATTEFEVDGVGKVADPVGMSAQRISADVMLFIAHKDAIQNLTSAMEIADIEPNDFVIVPLSIGASILKPEELEIGTLVIDIGAGTTEFAVFINHEIRYAGVVPYAGDSITNDISAGLGLARHDAEKIKTEHGCSLESAVSEKELIQIPGIGGRAPRQKPKRTLAMIIEARVEEILMLVRHQIEQAGLLDKIPAGVVITGGSSLIDRIAQLTERVFNVPARIGIPAENMDKFDIIKTPEFSAAWGTILVRAEREKWEHQVIEEKGKLGILWAKTKRWILSKF